MKNRLLLLVTLYIFSGMGIASATENTMLTLALDDALARVEYHSDYQAWLDSVDNVESTIQGIEDKHLVGLNLSGNLLRYSYNLDGETSSLNTGPSLTLEKSSLGGTTLTGSLSPSWNIGDLTLNTSWSLDLRQTIWPSPRLSSDQIALSIAGQSKDVLAEQWAYMAINTQFKIEELYRIAQFANARVAFAETSLENARANLHVATQKLAMGEASEIDMITSELGVLRAERELELSISSAQSAKDNLLAAIELGGEYELHPLDIDFHPPSEVHLDLKELSTNLKDHPLVLHYEHELEKAQLELEAAHEESKPQASLDISLGETQRGTEFQAAVSIGYPILDRNQQASTIDSRVDSLAEVQESYADAIENLQSSIEDAIVDLTRLERDNKIADLTLRQAELELAAAKQQYDTGIIDESSLISVEMSYAQAQLDYLESVYQLDLAKRRLSYGIVGDLPGVGGMSR